MSVDQIKALIVALSVEERASLMEFMDRDLDHFRFLSKDGVDFGCASGDGSKTNLRLNRDGHIVLNVYEKITDRKVGTHHELEDIKRIVSVLQFAIEKMEEDYGG